jgi:hypothetical protein
MDVSYSAWRQSTKESLGLKPESFSFLFDRRYTNRLNRMSRVFFDAYVRATNELAAQEDRFPSLSEIDAKMESGAVYAFKDRLTKSTEFFDEVKISGVSYLVPKAKRFIDTSGTYTDLAFDFDLPAVTLPARRKMPSPLEISQEKTPEVMPAIGEPSSDEVEPTEHTEEDKIDLEEEQAKRTIDESPSDAPLQIGQNEPVRAFESQAKAADEAATESIKEASEEIEKPADAQRDAIKRPPIITKAVIGLIALAIAVGAGAYVLFYMAESPKLVEYSTFLSNATQGNYLGVDIRNQYGISNEMEMIFPPNIDRSISSRGGIITISHSGNTLIRLNSSTDASVRLYLSGNWTAIPVVLNLAVPQGYDSGLVVHAKDYNVKRNDDKIILRFNCTHEGISFEQSYTPRR